MKINRRGLIRLGFGSGGIFLFPLALQQKVLAQGLRIAPNPSSKTWQPYANPLPIPPTLSPVCSNEGGNEKPPTDYYEITMKKSQKRIAGEEVEIWGYNGVTPGPIIRQRKGRESVVRFINKLGSDEESEPIRTALHLHGMASLPQYDGYAEDYIQPEHYKDFYYPNDRAATIWYHDHALHDTERNVRKGLAGLYIVEDATELNLPLPKGDYDVPLAFQIHPDTNPTNYNGTILVNGEQQPYMKVAPRKYRFRLLNGTVQNIINLRVGNLGFTVVGTDGGLMRAPIKGVKELRLTSGERYEIIVDFATVRQTQKSLYLYNGTDDLMRFDISADPVEDPSSVPEILRTDRNPPRREDATVTRVFDFDKDGEPECDPSKASWAINGEVWPTTLSDPFKEAVEVWRFVNHKTQIHPVHVHLIDMVMISRTGGFNPGMQSYEKNAWKDVFYLGNGETVEVLGKFGPHVGKYMMHCHNLLHEDCDMMVTFQVRGDADGPLSNPARPLPPDKTLPELCRETQASSEDYDFEAIRLFNDVLYGPNN